MADSLTNGPARDRFWPLACRADHPVWPDVSEPSQGDMVLLVKVGIDSMRTLLAQNPDKYDVVDAAITKVLEAYKARKGELMESVDEIVGFEEPQNDADRRSYEAIGAAIEVHSQCRCADGRRLSGSRSRDRLGDGRAIIADGLSHRVRSYCVAVG